MCAAEPARGASAAARASSATARGAARAGSTAYGSIIVVGGGCYGSYYVRQLGRARKAGAITWKRLLVIDRDPLCRMAKILGGNDGVRGAELVTSDWTSFFEAYLAGACRNPESAASDAIVPSPLMPHLMYDWLLARSRSRWPQRTVERVPLPDEADTPWQRAAPDGTHYVSFAEWMCPINCIEPERCPHTRGPRSWSMPPTVRAYVARERAGGDRIDGPAIFHCTHRVYGVGMFDTAEAIAADATVAKAAANRAARVLVATVSHCHGALGIVAIGPPSDRSAVGDRAARGVPRAPANGEIA
ncbi:MAG: hypothetical protein ACRENI_10550 [Gemmatimonadaceae bacterium]